MKTKIALYSFISLISLSAIQTGAAQAAQRLAVLTQVSDRIQAISLDDTGRVEVSLRASDRYIYRALTGAAQASAIALARQLVNAQLEVRVQPGKCMILPAQTPTLEVNMNGALREVLTPRDCTQRKVVYPRDPRLVQVAERLQTGLLTVANQLLTQGR